MKKDYLYISFIFLCFSGFGLGSMPLLSKAFKKYPLNHYQKRADTDSLHLQYPLKYRTGVLKKPYNPIDLNDPMNIVHTVEYDPITHMYIISETIGGRPYLYPQYLTFEEYSKYQLAKSKADYFKAKAGGSSIVKNRGIIPTLIVNSELFDRIFGGNKIDIKPQGQAELTFAYQHNTNDNPLFNSRQRSQGSLDFNERIQINVVGQIGEKLKILTNFNTEAQFDFENQVKFEYTGKQDEIIRKIELGNVSMPLPTTLITGTQNLFGLKTQLQFGKLGITTILSQQKSQRKQININNGSQQSTFKFSADNYDANRHYFLAQYFRDNYNNALKNLPIINSPIVVGRIEVWVTNKTTGLNSNARDVIGFLDLGEKKPYNPNFQGGIPNYNSPYPNSKRDPVFNTQPSNNLLDKIPADTRNTNSVSLNGYFQSTGGTDNYGKVTYARLLGPNEYTLNPTLGYISLNQPLNADEILSVAYQYTAGGVQYQVGDLSTDLPVNTTTPQVLYTKLLKNAVTRVNLPTWKLQMKNFYSLGAYQINPNNFTLNITRLDENSGVEELVCTQGSQTTGKRWLQLTQLDNLNAQQENVPDGIFDFIQNITIDATAGNIIFPVLEPFGSDLAKQFAAGETALKQKFIYQQLYDSTKFQAQQFPALDRYLLKGTYQSASTGEYNLNAFNIPQGSVVVTAGGVPLIEGQDFTVDYNLGRVKILNQSLVTSGIPIQINLEDNSLYGLQQKSLIGTRLDYIVNKDFHLGATFMNLSEKPLTQNVNVGSESINNTQLGLDGGYHGVSKWLTKMINHIPFLQKSTTLSTYTLNGEIAEMLPGHNAALNIAGDNGVAYIDDFESTSSTIDLRSSTGWFLSGTPQRFPEANLSDNLAYGFNRSKLAFYNIDPIFYDRTSNLTPPNIQGNIAELSNPRVREVDEPEIFPNLPIVNGQSILTNTLDLAFFPNLRGPYNYASSPALVNPDGTLRNPKNTWGGIARAMQSTDFQALNVQYIEFWVMDPFLTNPNSAGGTVYFDLGSISEDILKDGRASLENALPGTSGGIPGINGVVSGLATDSSALDTTAWGAVARTHPVTQSFANDPTSRLNQDVGLDGLSDANEQLFFSNYLNSVSKTVNAAVYANIKQDPSSDNYHYYRGADLDQINAGILKRYQNYNGLEGNSPTSDQSLAATGISSTASTSLPDQEDINRDNNLSTDESYYEYKFSVNRDSMVIGKNNIVAIQQNAPGVIKLANGTSPAVNWYQVKIPISSPIANIGSISDFNSIRFIRMYLAGFQDTTVLRFGRLQLSRGEWRPFATNVASQVIKDPAVPAQNTNSSLINVGTVNLFANSTNRANGIEYNLPPGIQQQQNISSLQQNLKLNEQSLVIDFDNLSDGFTTLAYKNIGGLNSNKYGRIKLFIHAEAAQSTTGFNPGPLNDNDVQAVVRLGQDYINNYYEYDIPLAVTKANAGQDQNKLWPSSNNLDVALQTLKKAKLARNTALLNGLPWPLNIPYPYSDPDNPGNQIQVVGNPDLSNIVICMLGVRNPYKTYSKNDDGLAKSGELWFDELRLVDFNEKGGWAAQGTANLKLADFANVTVSGLHQTAGFGSLESGLSDLKTQDESKFDITTNVDLGKFFSKRSGINLPMFFYYSHDKITPQYDPNNPDILLADELKAYTDPHLRDSVKNAAIEIDTRKSLSFSNIRKMRTDPKKKPHFWDIENFSASYSFTEVTQSSYLVQSYLSKTYKGVLEYGFQTKTAGWAPFQKIVKSSWLNWLRDLNINLIPSAYNFRLDIDRFYSENTLRANQGNGFYQAPTTYSKTFYLTRNYGLHWDLTRSLKLDYQSTVYSSIDEPLGALNQHSRDSTRQNLLHFGRNTDFTQNVTLSYTLPFSKFKYLGWMNGGIRYSTNFEWRSASLAVLKSDTAQLGNSIQNQRQIGVEYGMDLNAFYKQFKFLDRYLNKKPAKGKTDLAKAANQPLPSKLLPRDNGKNSKPVTQSEVQKEVNPYVRVFFQLLTSIKSIKGTFTRSEGTFIPGFLPKPNLLGEDIAMGAPGYGFIFGSQADIRAKAAAKGWLTKYSRLETQYVKTFQTNLNLTASLEPIPDLRISLTGIKTFLYSTQSNFRFDSVSQTYTSQNPITTGSYSITNIPIKTAFERQVGGITGLTNTFNTFQLNRTTISQRLASGNPLSIGDSAGYASGYGPLSQDVLINSFLAAYTGQNPNKIGFNLFKSIPLPGWKINYGGLGKLEFLKEIFASLILTHGYRSTYTINSFTSSLAYSTDAKARDQNNDYFPKYQISYLNISEYFEPLFGIDARFKNNLITKLSYNKSRVISFAVANSQLSEIFNKEIVFGAGYHAKNFRLPFKIRGETIVLKNDLNLKLDFAIRDSKSLIYQLDVPTGTVAGGLRNISYRPSIDYNLSKEFNFSLYYDANSTKPYTSNSFNSSFSTLGLSLRFIIGV